MRMFKVEEHRELSQLAKFPKPSLCSFVELEEEGVKHCMSLEMPNVSRCPNIVK